jgi:hypothetical protein
VGAAILAGNETAKAGAGEEIADLPGEFPRFAALPFVAIDDDIVAGLPVRCISERAAIVCAERLLTVFGNVGSVALRRSSVSSGKLDVIRSLATFRARMNSSDRRDIAEIIPSRPVRSTSPPLSRGIAFPIGRHWENGPCVGAIFLNFGTIVLRNEFCKDVESHSPSGSNATS